MLKKKALDILYPIRHELYKLANEENHDSNLLDEMPARNLAAGRCQAYSFAADQVDLAISKVIELED